jgi:hypothetical protein
MLLPLENLSRFNRTGDYAPILIAALIVDMAVMVLILSGILNVKALNTWYTKFGILAVIADVLSIVIGVILARFLYPLLFREYSLPLFLFVACAVQMTHDLLFSAFFNTIPRNKSAMLDVFKDYAKEGGPGILLADSAMMISTILLGSYLATLDTNTVIIVSIVALYILPYFVHSINV